MVRRPRSLFIVPALFALAACGGPDPTSQSTGGEVGLDEAALTVPTATTLRANTKLLGSLQYGQKSGAVAYTGSPHYLAYKFAGKKGDEVEIDVTSDDGDAMAYLSDTYFKVYAHNNDASAGDQNSHISYTLTSTRTYYVIFKEHDYNAATFHVVVANAKACLGGHRLDCAPGSHWDWAACSCTRSTCGVNPIAVTCIQGTAFNGATCSCEPIDCRSSGCGAGDYCSFCWGHYACLPKGALC